MALAYATASRQKGDTITNNRYRYSNNSNNSESKILFGLRVRLRRMRRPAGNANCQLLTFLTFYNDDAPPPTAAAQAEAAAAALPAIGTPFLSHLHTL